MSVNKQIIGWFDYLVEKQDNIGVFLLKVIIKDKFYEFQNPKTEKIFDHQKDYLTDLIRNNQGEENLEELLTSLFSLYNLSEALIHKLVDENGKEDVINILNANEVE